MRRLYLVGMLCSMLAAVACRNTREGVSRDIAESRDSVCHEEATMDLLEATEGLIADINTQVGAYQLEHLDGKGTSDGLPDWVYKATFSELTILRLRHAAAMVRLKRGMPISEEDQALVKLWNPETNAPIGR
jgi:predicted small secreted protein